jgi:hypothetical protein
MRHVPAVGPAPSVNTQRVILQNNAAQWFAETPQSAQF